MLEKFAESQQATLFDSDPKKLRFRIRNVPDGAEISTITADDTSDFSPRLVDCGPSLTQFVVTEPYETRNRNRVNFQVAFQTPPPVITPQPPVVTEFPTFGNDTADVHSIHFDDPDIFTHSGAVIKSIQLPIDPNKTLLYITAVLNEAWVGPGTDVGVNFNIFINNLNASDTNTKQLVPIPQVGAGATYSIFDPPTPALTLFNSATLYSIPCEGQSLLVNFGTVGGFLMDQATAGILLLQLHFQDRIPNNAIHVNYFDPDVSKSFQAQPGNSAILNLPNMLPPGSSTVRLKKVTLFCDRPLESAAPGTTNVTATVSMNSGATVFATLNVGDNLFQYDTTADSGAISVDYTGQAIGIGIAVDNGTLSQLIVGSISVEFEWENVVPQPPIVTPFRWFGSQLNLCLMGSIDGLQYTPVAGVCPTSHIASGISPANGLNNQVTLLLPNALTVTPPVCDSFIFQNAVCIYPATVTTNIVVGNYNFVSDPGIYNFWRIIVTRDDVEGDTNDDDVRFSITAMAREV